jgi:uncharacterized alkaline shock family protein YloU
MKEDTPTTIPIVSEATNSLGTIEINNAVIAQIVQLFSSTIRGN